MRPAKNYRSFKYIAQLIDLLHIATGLHTHSPLSRTHTYTQTIKCIWRLQRKAIIVLAVIVWDYLSQLDLQLSEVCVHACVCVCVCVCVSMSVCVCKKLRCFSPRWSQQLYLITMFIRKNYNLLGGGTVWAKWSFCWLNLKYLRRLPPSGVH